MDSRTIAKMFLCFLPFKKKKKSLRKLEFRIAKKEELVFAVVKKETRNKTN